MNKFCKKAVSLDDQFAYDICHSISSFYRNLAPSGCYYGFKIIVFHGRLIDSKCCFCVVQWLVLCRARTVRLYVVKWM